VLIARLLPLVLAVFALVGPLRADDLPDCANPADQYSMTYCAAIEYEAADADLNALWPKVVAVARANDEYVGDVARQRGLPTTFEALRNAQRAWIRFRDAQCDYESYTVFGGTAQPMVVSLCLARLTRERFEVLSQVLESR